MNTGQEDLAGAVQAAFDEEAGELVARMDRALNAIAVGLPEGAAPYWLELQRTLHTLKGAAATVGLAKVRDGAHALEERVRTAADDAGRPSHETLQALFDAVDALRAAMSGAGLASAAREADGAAGDWHADRWMRIRPERIDALHALLGDLALGRAVIERLLMRMRGLREQADGAEVELKRLATRLEAVRARLPAETWKELRAGRAAVSASLGDLSRQLSVLQRQAPAVAAQSAAQTERLAGSVRELRLMPVQPFLEEFARTARETARECGKQVAFSARAGDAEIDRSVLLRLREPLLHLVRNAVSHGLETPEERLAAGKPSEGRVALEARCEGGRVLIRVADDGRGIDPAGIEEKARRQGLSTGGVALDERRLLEVLVQPGFSSRETADILAGRGIGLDVVAGAIRDLSGLLSLENRRGAGCAFTLELPISAATAIGLVVRTGEQRFALPLDHVERVLRLRPEAITELEGRALARVGDELLAVAPLAKLVGLDEVGPRGSVPAAVLRCGSQRLVVTVDELIGEQPLIVGSLGPSFAPARQFSGGAVQADGSVLLVLNVERLFAQATGAPAAPSRRPGPAPEPAAIPSLLVVDDSITMRTLLRNILRAAGYQVTVAHDGEAGFAEFKRLERCELVVTDLQMPRLDGVGLCRAVRSSARPQTPLVMVTSVGSTDERRRALEAGADAYIVKGDFDQTAFLELVARLTGGVSRDARPAG